MNYDPFGNEINEDSNMKTAEEIRDRIAEFSDKTFGIERPFTAPLHHLLKEVKEVIESGEIEEFADMQLLLFDAYRKKFPQFTFQVLLDCCDKKIDILYQRRWGNPDENGVFEHIRDASELTAELTQKLARQKELIKAYGELEYYLIISAFVNDEQFNEAARLREKIESLKQELG